MENKKTNARKKLAPWIVAIAVIFLAGAYIGFLIWAQLTIHEVNGASIYLTQNGASGIMEMTKSTNGRRPCFG